MLVRRLQFHICDDLLKLYQSITTFALQLLKFAHAATISTVKLTEDIK